MCGVKCLIHPKLQRFHPTIYLTGDCLSMLRLKLIYVSKWDPGVLYTRLLSINHHQGFLWNHTNWFVVLENPKHTCLSVHIPLRLNYRNISKCPLNISSLGQTSAINVIFVAKTASCIMNYRVAYTHTHTHTRVYVWANNFAKDICIYQNYLEIICVLCLLSSRPLH